MTNSYTLNSNLLTFRDHDSKLFNKEELLAQIASDDYFAMLATTLDEVSQRLESAQHNDYVILEKLINDLLYLQHHYKLVKK